MKTFWDERFAGEDYHFGVAPNAFLSSQRHRLQAGWRALAVADGEGRNGVWLAEQGLDVLAVDFSARALEKSARLAASRGVFLRTELADVLDWSWGTADFDVIAAIFIQFVGSAERQNLHRSICRALKPGGLLLLQGYTPKQLEYGTGGPSSADNLYTASDLKREFEGLEFLHLCEHESVLHEGVGHHGMSALVDLVARKPEPSL